MDENKRREEIIIALKKLWDKETKYSFTELVCKYLFAGSFLYRQSNHETLTKLRRTLKWKNKHYYL